MRLLLLFSFFLLACRTHTIPVGSMPAYAANQPVLTREGMALSIEDGGTAVLVPHEGHCLSRLSSRRDGTVIVGEDPSIPCRRIVVQRVEMVDAGEVLRIDGKTTAVEVDPRLVESVSIKGPKLGAVDFAPHMKPRSPGMIVAGSLLMGAGLAGATALFTLASEVEEAFLSDLAVVFYSMFGVLSLGAGLGPGIPLVVLGSRPVRAPQVDQPRPPPGIQLSGVGLRWVFD